MKRKVFYKEVDPDSIGSVTKISHTISHTLIFFLEQTLLSGSTRDLV